DRREHRIREQHHDERAGEQPRQIFHPARDAHFVANRAQYVVTAQDEEKIRDRQQGGHQLATWYWKQLQDWACKATSSSVSRSAVMPARNADWRSSGRVRCHASVARAVSGNGRNVRPAANAFAILTRPKPPYSATGGTQTGMCDH